jgi:hypothetical protein
VVVEQEHLDLHTASPPRCSVSLLATVDLTAVTGCRR